MQVLFFILLFVLGTCFGSFLCCQARRLHLKATNKRAKPLGNRSVCLKCHYRLKWYDNIPVLSWLFLRGHCRKCHAKIGLAELFSELGLGVAFLLIGTTIDPLTADPWSWALFAIALIFMLITGFLAIYDGLYGELPTKYLVLAIIVAFIHLIVREASLIIQVGYAPSLITDPLFAVLILGGLYCVLYCFSKGKWVGDGDWLLATALAIVLFYPFVSLVSLFLANLLASAIMAPFVILRKNHRIYFGPFLVAAFVIAYSLADFLLTVI